MKKFLATILTVLISQIAFTGQQTLLFEPQPSCSKSAGTLPAPEVSEGTINSKIPVEHIVVVMQENHSFDNYFGMLNQTQFYGKELDGVQESFTNLDANGTPIHPYHEPNLCVVDTDHSWNAIHNSWNKGANDGFAKINGAKALGYFDQNDLPYYYELANQFTVADRYFSSALTSTFSNRYFLYAGTAFGHVKNDFPADGTQFSQATIFDSLTKNGISWKYYTDDKGYLALFGPMYQRNKEKMKHISDYQADIASNQLPQVVFLDASFDGQDEHPAANIQYGQSWVASLISPLMKSELWKSSALFFTYDEGGGFYDHVPPPKACVPDSIAPKISRTQYQAGYDYLGVRVPFILVSPFAKSHFVSHKIYDHSSILAFIEVKYNLPALSARDANADPMLEMFDFEHPRFAIPNLPSAQPVSSRSCTP